MSTIAMNMMMMLAAAAAPAGPAAPATHSDAIRDLLNSPFLVVSAIMIALMLWFSGSKRKREKEREAQLSAVKRGDRVQTIGGILGTVVDVRDSEVVVKVDEGNNTKLKFTRSAIHRIVREEDKADAAK